MILVIIASLIVGFDQLIKYLLQLRLEFGESIKGPLIDITLAKNTGTAFGLFAGQNIFFTALSIIAIVVIIILLFKTKKDALLYKIGLILIMSGAVSNLIDRLRFGYVIDYIDLRFWPVFNLADSAITAGAVIFLIALTMDRKNKGE